MEARSIGPNSYLQHHLGHFSWRVADEDSDAVGVAGGTVRALKVLAVHALLERLLLRQNNWDLAHRLVQVVLNQHLQGEGQFVSLSLDLLVPTGSLATHSTPGCCRGVRA